MTQVTKRRVMVWGTFDLLHEGHQEFLRAARNYGDELYVIVVPDEVVRANKKRAPIETASIRKRHLERLATVKAVYIDSMSQGLRCLDIIRPHVICLGRDQSRQWERALRALIREREIGASVVRLPQEFANGVHTSHLVGAR